MKNYLIMLLFAVAISATAQDKKGRPENNRHHNTVLSCARTRAGRAVTLGKCQRCVLLHHCLYRTFHDADRHLHQKEKARKVIYGACVQRIYPADNGADIFQEITPSQGKGQYERKA